MSRGACAVLDIANLPLISGVIWRKLLAHPESQLEVFLNGGSNAYFRDRVAWGSEITYIHIYTDKASRMVAEK